MKKTLFLAVSAAIVLMAFTSCAGKMKPLCQEYVKATPQPLELVGGKVPVTINATFPAKWFNKKAILEVTPILKYKSGEAWGTTYTFQGEKVEGNNRSISYKNGGNVEMKSVFKYTEAMRESELFLAFTVKMGKKIYELESLKVADGVVSTEALALATGNNPAIAPDKFQRIIKEAYDADIMFLIQQAAIRGQELKKGEVVDWKNLVKNAKEAPNQNVGVEIQAYASPDGGLDLNEKLAQSREKNTRDVLSKDFKKLNVPIDARYTAQDWEGFKALVEKSNVQDKDLVLRVLSMYKDPEEREREIKNISSVFKELAETILPRLRRSRLTANVEIIGKSDEEISQLAATDPGKLTVEEILYAATLTPDRAKEKAVYEKAIVLYPNDYRAYNNLGMIDYYAGNLKSAESWFEKANQKMENKESNLNVALIRLGEGKTDEAAELLGRASGTPETNSAMGMFYIKTGQYEKAEAEYGDAFCNNAAIAQILNKHYDKAMKTLESVREPNALTDYLKAVVSARTERLSDVLANLKAAFMKDPSLMAFAKTDLEFAKYRMNPAFTAVVK